MATTATPKTTKETPRAKTPPLFIGGPVYTRPEAIVSPRGTLGAPASGFFLINPIGVRTAPNANDMIDSSCSLAGGLGTQLHVAEAKMLGLTFSVAVIPTTPNTPKRIARVM